MIAQGDTYPEQIGHSRGQVIYRYNIREVQVEDMDGTRTTYEWDEVWVDPPITKGKVLAAMQLEEEGDVADVGAEYEDSKAAVALAGIAEMTYAELDNWINANVTDLASARAFLKKLGKVVLAILKRG